MEYIKNTIKNGYAFSTNLLQSLTTQIFNYILGLFKDMFTDILTSIIEAMGFKKDMIKIDDNVLSEIYNNLLKIKIYIPDIESNYKLLFCFVFLYIFNTLYILTNIHNIIIFPSSFFYNLWFNNIFLLSCFVSYYGSVMFYDLFISKENLSVSVLFVLLMFVTILIPKKYIISLIFCVVLIILNILILINLIN